MENHKEEETLRDAGCSVSCQQAFAVLPNDTARLCFLRRHRRRLMDSLHEIQEKLSCLDYMIYGLEQRQKGERKP